MAEVPRTVWEPLWFLYHKIDTVGAPSGALAVYTVVGMAEKPKRPRAKPISLNGAAPRPRKREPDAPSETGDGNTRNEFFTILRRIKKAPSRSD